MTKTTALLAASAFFAFTSGACAGNTIINLDGYCDQITIAQNSKSLVAALETDENGRCETFLGGGVIGRVKGTLGRQAVIGGIINSSPGTAYTFTFSWPPTTGGAWALFSTTDGATENLLRSGTYTVAGAASVKPPGAKRVGDNRH